MLVGCEDKFVMCQGDELTLSSCANITLWIAVQIDIDFLCLCDSFVHVNPLLSTIVRTYKQDKHHMWNLMSWSIQIF